MTITSRWPVSLRPKRLARRLLNALGFEIRRLPHQPTDRISADDFHTLWAEWIDSAPLRFAGIYQKNRQTQEHVSEWMSADTLTRSIYRYGIPSNDRLQQLNQVDRHITYTDLLSFLSTFLARPSYLEIGVSAGKNFYQIANQLNDALLAGIDIEEINPAFEKLFNYVGRSWESSNTFPLATYDGRRVEKRMTLTEYSQPGRGNRILYLRGSELQGELWEALKGMTFNLIFSDALHTPEAIDSEINFLQRYRLIDPNQLIMMWDDVAEWSLNSVTKAMEGLSEQFAETKPYTGLFEMQGTYGDPHGVAIFVYDGTLRYRRGNR